MLDGEQWVVKAEVAEMVVKNYRQEINQLKNEIKEKDELIAQNHPVLSNGVAIFTRFKDGSIEGVIASNDEDADQITNMSCCYPSMAESFMECYIEDGETEIEVKPIRI